MIIYEENPKDTTKKLPEPINEFKGTRGYRFNTKSQLYLYTLEMNNWKVKLKISFTIASKP